MPKPSSGKTINCVTAPTKTAFGNIAMLLKSAKDKDSPRPSMIIANAKGKKTVEMRDAFIFNS